MRRRKRRFLLHATVGFVVDLPKWGSADGGPALASKAGSRRKTLLNEDCAKKEALGTGSHFRCPLPVGGGLLEEAPGGLGAGGSAGDDVFY